MAELYRRAVLAAPFMAGAARATTARSAFDFGFTAIEGGPLPLAQFRGKPMLVVNTASFCGYTPQYAALQRLHDRFEQRGLVVLGVPSNDFHQESTDARRIREFCDAQFGITFPMTTPEHVRGAEAHPLFAWLAAQAGGPPRWNFHKYLVSRDGLQVQAFATRIEPDSAAMLRAIGGVLG